MLAVRLLTSNWVAWQISMEVRDGTLSAKLLRPIHPLYALAADHLSAVPMRALVISPIVALLFYTSWDRLVGHDPALAAGPGCSSLVGAWLLIFFAMVLLGALAFFIESSIGVVRALARRLRDLLRLPHPARGRCPTGWARAAQVLPFRFMLAFPVETLVGLLDPGAGPSRSSPSQWAYVALAFVGALTVWRAGVRRFAAYGG